MYTDNSEEVEGTGDLPPLIVPLSIVMSHGDDSFGSRWLVTKTIVWLSLMVFVLVATALPNKREEFVHTLTSFM